jgi:hypothetical protein
VPGGTAVRRTVGWAGPAVLGEIAWARAGVWSLAGFLWLAVAGKLPAGWLVIDLDAALITVRPARHGAVAAVSEGDGFPWLGPAWLGGKGSW